MVQYGKRVLQRGCQGEDVIELQIRLAGFRGTLLDGGFGPGTELQVFQFQQDVMKMSPATGVVDQKTMAAIDEFAEKYPIDFNALRCRCGVCSGFGQGRFKGEYLSDKFKTERYYRYEYPGMHRMLLWAVRAIFFYNPEFEFFMTSGYRCGVRNQQTGRESTNHYGKAIDLDILRKPDEDKREDMLRCEKVRGVIVAKSTAQVGWEAANRKAFEPPDIAPTWIHYDVRSYAPEYLQDQFFCKTLEELNNKLPIEI